MIAYKNNRPVLQTGHCVISDYDREWLAGVLQEAAEAAGTTLPMKDEIANGILLYLETHCPLHSVPLDFLFERMRRLLEQIGLPLIAANLPMTIPSPGC